MADYRFTILALGTLAALATATPSLADEPLAGARLITASHGQMFCTDPVQLGRLLDATIARSGVPPVPTASCTLLPDNAKVEIVEDLSPGTRAMHVVKARVADLFGPQVGYTYSVGLYAPVLRGLPQPPLPYE